MITDHLDLPEIKDQLDFLDHQEATVNPVNVDNKVSTEKRETKDLEDSLDHQDLVAFKVSPDLLDLRETQEILVLKDLLASPDHVDHPDLLALM